MDHGKYLHEVLEEATLQDIMWYMALGSMEAKEQYTAQRRATARAKAKGM